ncbi:MAG: hypothetical protein AB7P16_28460 [Bradyrhizobium sp.]|uniref:hypothetical protein n=1 Tax=Bradyrhizobium sp. TaxID=376 RepID=UPI003D0D256F
MAIRTAAIAALIATLAVALPAAADGMGASKATFYNSTGSKQVKPAAGRLVWVQAQGGTSPTVQFFDDEDGTCDENQITGTVTLVPDAAPIEYGFDTANGICMLVGGTAPEVTVGTR